MVKTFIPFYKMKEKFYQNCDSNEVTKCQLFPVECADRDLNPSR